MKSRRMVKKRVKVIIFIILGLIVVGGIIFALIHFDAFSSKKEVSSSNKENIKEPTNNDNTEEVKRVQIVDENSTSRPFAVMINNAPAARPYQSGLQDAYIIYEIIAEGGITRYLALFKDQTTSRIASVRSARDYFIDYALENDAYFVHWGWSPQAEELIKSQKINNINGLAYEGTYFKRDNTLNVALEHRGYTTMELLNKAVEKLKYRTVTNKGLLLDYSIDNIDLKNMPEAKIANKVNIKYSNSITTNYEYDEKTGLYYRSVNNKAQIDYVSKKQYTFKNIITYQVSNKLVEGDDKGRQVLNNVGSGTGYFITNGYAVPIKWEKKDRSSQTKYYYLSNEELIVNDGNTFIQIQPTNQTLQITE